MKRLVYALGRARWPLLLMPILLSVFILRSSGSNPVQIAVIAVFVVAMLIAGAMLLLNLAGVDPDVDQRVANLTTDPASAELLTRWLSRSKHFRFVGGAAGFVLGLGWTNTSLLTLLLSLLAGVAAGGAAAELHSLRRPTASPASANMIVRRVGDYVQRVDAVAMAAIAVTASMVVVLSALSSNSRSGSATIASAAALVVVVMTYAMQRFVIVRPRPALPADLRRADDLMRRLAATVGFTKPAIALSLGLLATGLEWFGSDGLGTLLALLLWGASLGWYIDSRQSSKNLLAEVCA